MKTHSDPRRSALVQGIIDRIKGRVWNAQYRQRLAGLSDDEIREIAANPEAHRWLGHAKLRELMIALAKRKLGFEILPPGFSLTQDSV